MRAVLVNGPLDGEEVEVPEGFVAWARICLQPVAIIVFDQALVASMRSLSRRYAYRLEPDAGRAVYQADQPVPPPAFAMN